MGKIRLSSFRRQQALPDTDTTENEKKDVEDVEHIEHIHLEEKAFPVVPRNAKDQDLQLVPASEVWKQDGKGGNRLWIVVDNVVLDVTEYQTTHPGGRSIIAGFGGQDCSWQWWSFHDRTIWRSVAAALRVGRAEGIENPHERPPTIVGLRRFGLQEWD